MNYKIEKDIPVESSRSKYPFADMEIGDSFLFDGQRSVIQSAINSAKKKLVMNFTVSSVDGGFRVWRIEGEPK